MSVYSDLIASYAAVASFPLDESGPTVLDRSGHGYTGLSEGVAGGPVPFAGSGASVQLNGSTIITLGSTLSGYPLAGLPHTGAPFSYEAWFQAIDNNLGGGGAAGGPIFNCWTGGLTLGTRLMWSFDDDPNGDAILQSIQGGSIPPGAAAALTPDLRGAWHHLVATWDGVAVALYVDGAALALSGGGTLAGFGSGFVATQAQIGGSLVGPGFSGNLAWVSLYGAALTPCQVQSLYDAATTGAFTPCLDVIRLRHGQSHDVCWETDSRTTRIKQAGVDQIVSPLPVLGTVPALLVGQDPLTGVPAFCPLPPPSAPVPTPPVVVPATPIAGGTDPCVQARCGAALAMTQHLQSLYQNWQTWINAAISAIGAVAIATLGAAATAVILDWLATLLAGLEAAGAILSSVMTVFQAIKPLLATVSGVALGGVLPAWDTTTVDNVQRVFFAALQCTGGTVSITAGDMTNVAGYIRANTASFLGNIVSELLAASCDYSALTDWQAVITSASPSNLCNGY